MSNNIIIDEIYAARFISRENRFVIKAELTEDSPYHNAEKIVKAHLPDPGRLKELLKPGASVYLLPAAAEGRKTDYTAQFIKSEEDNYVSLNSTLPNKIVEKGLKNNYFLPFRNWSYSAREFKYHNSRWDFLLKNNTEELYLEVKSVTLARGNRGFFPDAVSKRAKKHITELIKISREKNKKAGLLFIAQRSDIESVEAAADIDPEFAGILQKAAREEVIIAAYKLNISLKKIELAQKIPVII
ncbi:MAG: DNA/RNA nuclease SfsA [Bacillota bacterium]